MFQTVYTFEPDPVLFQCLTRNIDYPNVVKIQACLGNERKLVGTKNDAAPSCGGTHIDERNGIIPTIFIDDLNLPRCDLIHLDIEGYEFNALRGGLKTIERCKPIIVLEYFEQWLSRFRTNIEEIESLLRSIGYSHVGLSYFGRPDDQPGHFFRHSITRSVPKNGWPMIGPVIP